MTVAEARAICAELEEHLWDDVVVAAAITEVTAMLLAVSPQVTPVSGAPGLWWVGASGFGGMARQADVERELALGLRRLTASWHPRARVAIADSCVAARAATWAGTSYQRGDDRSLVCIVPHGHDAAYLAPAPLALVPMDEELREALHALGLRTVGAFAGLSPEEVEQRWGADGLQAWRLSRGDDRRRPVLVRVPDRPVVEAELPAPSPTMEPVLFLVRAAVERLAAQLAARGQAVAALAITLTLDDARGALPVNVFTRPHTVTREVRLARPAARAAPLFERCRALLDDWTLTAPAIGVAVAVVAAGPLTGEQGDLLATTWRDPAALDAALARLRAELGPDSVVRPFARDAYVPERMGWWREGGGGRREEGDSESGRSAAFYDLLHNADSRFSTSTSLLPPPSSPLPTPALRLLETPDSVFVVCDGGAPSVVTWRGRRITVERAVGPERLSGDWWDDGYRRDYWRCESVFGDFLLYLDRSGGEDVWWLQGWYD
jgi:protein ImuB